jgi:hypothetical protein
VPFDIDSVNETFERLVPFYALFVSIIRFFQKLGYTITFPQMDWPGWVTDLTGIFVTLLAELEALLPGVPNLNTGAVTVLLGLMAPLLFVLIYYDLYWAGPWPITRFVVQWIPALLVLLSIFGVGNAVFARSLLSVLVAVLAGVAAFGLFICRYQFRDSLPGLVDAIFGRSKMVRSLRGPTFDWKIHQLVAALLDAAAAVPLLLFSGLFPEPLQSYALLVLALCLVLFVCHLLSLWLLFRGRGRVSLVVKDFLKSNGPRLLYLWLSFCYAPAVSSAVLWIVESANGCGPGEFAPLDELNTTFIAEYVMLRAGSCQSCVRMDGACGRLCSGRHGWEAAPVIPPVIFILTALGVAMPIVIWAALKDVRQVILSLCSNCEADFVLQADRLEHWHFVTRGVPSPALSFVRNYRYSRIYWLIWQLVNPLVPALLASLSEVVVWEWFDVLALVWSIPVFIALLYFRPHNLVTTRWNERILEGSNMVLGVLPVLGAHVASIPEAVVLAFSLVAVLIPIALVIWTIWYEHRERVRRDALPDELDEIYPEHMEEFRRVSANPATKWWPLRDRINLARMNMSGTLRARFGETFGELTLDDKMALCPALSRNVFAENWRSLDRKLEVKELEGVSLRMLWELDGIDEKKVEALRMVKTDPRFSDLSCDEQAGLAWQEESKREATAELLREAELQSWGAFERWLYATRRQIAKPEAKAKFKKLRANPKLAGMPLSELLTTAMGDPNWVRLSCQAYRDRFQATEGTPDEHATTDMDRFVIVRLANTFKEHPEYRENYYVIWKTHGTELQPDWIGELAVMSHEQRDRILEWLQPDKERPDLQAGIRQGLSAAEQALAKTLSPAARFDFYQLRVDDRWSRESTLSQLRAARTIHEHGYLRAHNLNALPEFEGVSLTERVAISTSFRGESMHSLNFWLKKIQTDLMGAVRLFRLHNCAMRGKVIEAWSSGVERDMHALTTIVKQGLKLEDVLRKEPATAGLPLLDRIRFCRLPQDKQKRFREWTMSHGDGDVPDEIANPEDCLRFLRLSKTAAARLRQMASDELTVRERMKLARWSKPLQQDFLRTRDIATDFNRALRIWRLSKLGVTLEQARPFFPGVDDDQILRLVKDGVDETLRAQAVFDGKFEEWSFADRIAIAGLDEPQHVVQLFMMLGSDEYDDWTAGQQAHLAAMKPDVREHLNERLALEGALEPDERELLVVFVRRVGRWDDPKVQAAAERLMRMPKEGRQAVLEAMADERLSREWLIRQLARFDVTSEAARELARSIEARRVVTASFPRQDIEGRVTVLRALLDHFAAVSAVITLPLAWYFGAASAITRKWAEALC